MGMAGEEEEEAVLVTVAKRKDEKTMWRNAQELVGMVGDLATEVYCVARSGNGGLDRTRGVMEAYAPSLKQATHRVGVDIVQWMHQGGLWRSLLVMSVGLISVTALTGLAAFMMAVVVATVSAIIITLLMCLSAVGAFLAMFCTSLTFIYIGALATTAFIIGSAVLMASSAVLFFTGWILFAWATWEVMKKSLNLVRDTLGVSKKEEMFVA